MRTHKPRIATEWPLRAALLLILGPLFALLAVPTRAQAECCLREVYAAPFTLPAQAKQDWKDFFPTGISSPLHRKLAWSDCPPIEVWLTGKAKDHDYRFVGEVTTQGLTQIDHEGNLRGTFVARVRLIDPDHDDAVLREAKPVSWTGTITEGLAHKVYTYEPSTDSLNVSWDDKTAELGKQFMDIDELVYDYERKPQSCKVTLPEEAKDKIATGEVVTVKLDEIYDHKKRPSKEWQRVLVKVEKGKILNAEEKWGALYVFRVGKDARAEVRYQAPDDCSVKTENLTVFNTCLKKEGIEGDEKYQIATKTFDIVCDRWLVTVTYTEEWTVPGLALGEGSIKGSRSFTQMLKAELNRTRKGELTSYRRRFYETTTASLDLEDRFQQVTQGKEGCKVVAGWHGEKHGPVGAEVRLQFTDSQKQWYLDSEVMENGPAWKTVFQWSGCFPFPDGACEMTDTLSAGVVKLGSEMFTDSEPPVFEEGQDVIRGERRWSELGTAAAFQPEGNVYASANCRDGDLQSLFTTIIYYGLFNADRVQASKSIKWEIRRPGTLH